MTGDVIIRLNYTYSFEQLIRLSNYERSINEDHIGMKRQRIIISNYDPQDEWNCKYDPVVG